MKTLRLSAAVLVLSGSVAFAQTTPLNPIAAIIGPESSNCTNNYNLISTATGCGQMLQGTWDQIAPQIGVNTAQYPQMASAPLSDQFAAIAALYNQQGFGPWAPYDPTLAANIQANGGASAYAQPGTLSTNPADYAALDQPNGVQTYLASANTGTATAAATPGGSFSTMPDGVAQANGFPTSGTGSTITPTATAQPQIAVNATPGTLDLPYSWFYNVIITAFQQPFSNLLASMQLMVSSVLIPLLTLALMALSLRFLIARYVSIDQFSKFLIDMAFVIPFVAAGSYWYQTYVVNPVLGLPTFFQQYTAQAGGGINLTTPASGFDAAYVGFFHAAEQVWHESTGFWHSLWVAVVVTVALWFIIGAITEMFGAFLVATVLSFLVLLVGPLAIPCVLFQTTRKLFFGWVWVGATIILSLLAIELVLGLYMGVIHQMLMASQMSGTPDTDVPAFCGAAAGMVLLGVCMYFVKPMVEAIGGAVAVGVDRAGYYATGQHVWTTAKVGARAAGAAMGG